MSSGSRTTLRAPAPAAGPSSGASPARRHTRSTTRSPGEAATSRIRLRVSAATLGEPLRARETRLRETPAARATSLWVAA